VTEYKIESNSMVKLTREIREAALEFIEQHGRPLSISEIRGCLEGRCDLWKRVEGKSEDYVRVTISSTPGKMFEKYGLRLDVEVGGNEGRRLYWGRAGVLYGEEWERLSVSKSEEEKTRERKRERERVKGCSGNGVQRAGAVCGDRCGRDVGEVWSVPLVELDSWKNWDAGFGVELWDSFRELDWW
jgi:hypothetical protein